MSPILKQKKQSSPFSPTMQTNTMEMVKYIKTHFVGRRMGVGWGIEQEGDGGIKLIPKNNGQAGTGKEPQPPSIHLGHLRL